MKFNNQTLYLFSAIVTFFCATSHAQQNLFNVISADITEKEKFFFQQQFNFEYLSGSSNTTIDYGLGNNLEIGVNLFNVDMQSTDGVFENPHLLFNFQKGFNITDNYKISFGTQTGFSPPIHNNDVSLPSFSYVDSALNLNKLGKYYLGAYYANHAYGRSGNTLGIMAGVEYPLIENKFHLMADILSGNSEISVAVLGMVLFLPCNWQLSFGAQLPSPSSHNDYGLVVAITKL